MLLLRAYLLRLDPVEEEGLEMGIVERQLAVDKLPDEVARLEGPVPSGVRPAMDLGATEKLAEDVWTAVGALLRLNSVRACGTV